MITLTLITLLAVFIPVSFGTQHNITVNDTNPSIHYEGNAGDASLCQMGPKGQPIFKAGCYLVHPNCTSSAAMGPGGSGAASFTFRGTALYINSLLNDLSPVYTVTLDGKSTDVDGVRNSLPFTCYLLYSQTNLDPSVDHVVRLSVKGASPTRNQTIHGSDTSFNFALINFIYTAVNVTTTTSPSGSFSASSSATSNTTAAAPAHTLTSSNDVAGLSLLSSWSVLGTVLTLGCLSLM